jgi:chitinase
LSLFFILNKKKDLHGTWEPFTGHHAALYARADETGDQALLNVDWAAQYWISKGCPREKLILGMGSYGRAFKLVDINKNGLGAPANGIPTAGTYTREGGFLSYYEVCQRLTQGWTRVYNTEQQVPYAFNSNEWVGYDDLESLKVKVDYVKNNQFGGAMFWALDLDDFDGKFCGKGKYPLINFVKNELNSGSSGSTVSTMSTTTRSTVSASSTISASTSTSTTTTTTTRTTQSSQCYNGDGYYADKTSNCQQFYVCYFTGTQFATVTYISCPNGLLFDASITACNFAQQVTC